MPKENSTVFIILGLLTHENMSGYDIKKRIDTIIGNFWNAGYGQIYPTLKQLEQNKLVGKHGATDTKGPEKNVYSITEKGRKALTAWLLDYGEKETLRLEILVKLFFGNALPVSDNIKRVEYFRERNAKRLKQMELYKESLSPSLSESGDHRYYFLTVLFGQHLYTAYQNWADEALDILKEQKEPKERK